MTRFAFLTLLLTPALAHTAVASVPLPLIGELDPFAGNLAYSDVWGEGDFAYVGSFSVTGVAIIDISNPASPTLVATYDPAPGVTFLDVKVQDGIGYFSTDSFFFFGSEGVHIVDLSNPSSPSLITKLTAAQNGFLDATDSWVEELESAKTRSAAVEQFGKETRSIDLDFNFDS